MSLTSYDTDGLTNVLLGPEKHSAKYINIVTGDVPRPVTIVVSHYDAAVLNFSGNVDQVDQVIAMGSRRLGWDRVAKTGIDVRKVSFLPVVGRDRSLNTSCSAPPMSCVPDQYFKMSDQERRWPGGVPLGHQYVRMEPTTLIGALRQSSVVIPEETPIVVDEAAVGSETTEYKRPENWHEEVAWYNTSTDDFLGISQDQLVSPTSVSLDGNLPSWAGILGMVEDGSIRPAGDYDTDQDLIRFSTTFTERYKTRFDQDFGFEPDIDFVLHPSFRGETLEICGRQIILRSFF